MSNDLCDVLIVSNYKDYTPPFPVDKIISDLLNGIPSHFVRGLHSIVLSNATELNRDRRRQTTLSRKRKVKINKCSGLYHGKWKNEPAAIELFVDNIINNSTITILKFRLFKKMAFKRVLFHELGHHIHATSSPEYREREDVAEQWRRKLTREYARKCYWYLKPISPILKILSRFFRYLRKKI